MHPTEQILNDIKNKLEISVDGLKTVLWVDMKPDLEDLPVCIITVGGEVMSDYHNHFYRVELDVELKFIAIDEGFDRDVTKLLTIINDADAILKNVSTRLDTIMRFSEIATSEVTDTVDAERPMLVATRTYGITYKRTRGLS